MVCQGLSLDHCFEVTRRTIPFGFNPFRNLLQPTEPVPIKGNAHTRISDVIKKTFAAALVALAAHVEGMFWGQDALCAIRKPECPQALTCSPHDLRTSPK